MESGNEGVDETALSITDGEGFVVVVVVVADKEGGGNEGDLGRVRVVVVIFEGEMAGLAALAAVTLAVECQEV
ncbi:MAG: hypothetical protein JNJ78_16120, partial [Anaerolineae bacterium]|nr:hypothetical protein [Anaerolineae bacterium]